MEMSLSKGVNLPLLASWQWSGIAHVITRISKPLEVNLQADSYQEIDAVIFKNGNH